MKNLLTTMLFLIAFLLHAKSQSTGATLYGTVRDSKGILPGATVSLRTAQDSSLLSGISTDNSGKFEFKNIKKGNYLLEIFFIGYVTYRKHLIINDDLANIGEIMLSEGQRSMKEVVVTGRKPLLSVSQNKIIVNIEGSVYKAGENGYRLFNVIPGVRSDANGAINFRGVQSVQVYVDGRQIYLSGTQLMNYLKSIPSESIKSMEIIAVPSAEFSANSNGAIINIVLKSEYKYGFTGNISSSFEQNRYSNYNGDVLLNYRKGKFNLQTQTSYSIVKTFADDIQSQVNYPNSVFSTQDEKFVQHTDFLSLRLRADYQLSEKQLFSVSYLLNSNSGRTTGTASNIFNPAAGSSKIDSVSATDNVKRLSLNDQRVSLFYLAKFDTLGSKVNAGYSYVYYDNKVNSTVSSSINAFSKPAAASLINIENPLLIPISTVNVDVDKLYSGKKELKLGAKYDFSNTDDNNVYFRGISRIPDPAQSNRFIYNEKIFGLYSSFSKEFQKNSIEVGLRAEHTYYNGHVGDDYIGRNKWDLFPSVYLQQTLFGNDRLSLAYNRRISRPAYQLLNPFQDISNPYFISRGNPRLNPYYSQTLETSYLLKSKYSLTVGFKHSGDVINNVYIPEGNTIISTYDNVNNENEYYLSLYVPIELRPWWSISFFTYLGNKTIDVNTAFARKIEKFTPYLSLVNRFSLKNGYFAEVNGFYLGRSFYSIYNLHPQGVVNLAFKKTILNGKMTFSLNANDPLSLKRIKIDIDETTFNRHIQNFLPNTTFSAGISYNIAKGKKDTSKENINTPNSDQLNRLNK